MAKLVVLLVASILAALVNLAHPLSMTVYRTECVQENVEYEGDTVSGNFVVVDHEIFWASDHPGIDLEVTSPAGNVVASVKGSAGDTFKFRAPRSGLYKFCFHNTAPSPETVAFYIHVGHIPTEHNLAKDEHLNPVNVKIAELREALESVTSEQHYLRARVERHHHTNKSTQKRVLLYTMAEYLLLLFASVAQVLIIRHMFNRRAGYSKV